MTALGAAFALSPLLAVLVCALAVVVIAMRGVERLCVALFLLLPYMVVNMPTGAFTLKLPEAVAYLLAAAALGRAMLRREPLLLPPATIPVIAYLGVMAVATACAPAIPVPYLGSDSGGLRASPSLRSLSAIVWLGLSWLVVIAVYNVVGRRPDLYRRCVCAHIVGGGVAAIVSLGMFVLSLLGLRFANALGSTVRDLVRNEGGVFRLAGVAYEPMFLGFYLQTVIPVTTVVLLLRHGWLPRWTLRLCLAAQCLAMILAFSSGGWAGLLVSFSILSVVLFAPLFRDGRLPRRLLAQIGATLLLVVLVGGGVAMTQAAASRIVSRTLGKIGGGSRGDAIRADEFAVGWSAVDARPLLGVGPGLAAFYFPRFHPVMQSQSLTGLREINSLYITTLAETGLIGFCALMWCGIVGTAALASAVRRAGSSNVPILTALSASLVGCAVQYFSLNPLFLIYFTGLVGLAVTGARLAPTDAERPQ